MADFNIKRGDTWPPVEAVLRDGEVDPLDLTTAAAIKLILKSKGSGSTVIEGVCTITDAAGGAVRYDWDPTDTAIVNSYDAEFEITWTDDTITTVPTVGYKEVAVLQDLA